MINQFFKKALLFLSNDPFSYGHHLKFWTKELLTFPKNKDLYLQVINSPLFDWKYSSSFSDEFQINPLTQAISESDHILDILYPDPERLKLKTGEDPAEFLKVVYERYLLNKSIEEIRKIHPIFNFVVAEYCLFEFNRFLKKILIGKDAKKYINFIQNCITMFSSNFFKSSLFPRADINPSDFWSLVALGISFSPNEMEQQVIEEDTHFFTDKAITEPIFDFYDNGTLPKKLKQKYPSTEEQQNLANYLTQLKNNPSLVVLLKLR